MRKHVGIVSVALILMLAIAPALATAMRVVYDVYNESNGYGICLMIVDEEYFTVVWYVDNNGDGEYTRGKDTLLRIESFKPSSSLANDEDAELALNRIL